MIQMKLKTIGFMLMATAALAGCNQNDNNGATPADPNDNNIEQTSFDDGDGNSPTNDRNNRQDFDMNDDKNGNGDNEYDVSDKAADKITDQVKGIDSAYVVTTENNAYVAADFKDSKTDDNGANGTNGMDGTTGNNGTDGMNGTTGTNGMDDTTGSKEKNGMNADNDDQLTDDIKQQISDVVKSIDGDIDNVYVSTNPEFLDSVKNYADQAKNGDPVKGLFNQMGNMIERVFPQNNK